MDINPNNNNGDHNSQLSSESAHKKRIHNDRRYNERELEPFVLDDAPFNNIASKGDLMHDRKVRMQEPYVAAKCFVETACRNGVNLYDNVTSRLHKSKCKTNYNRPNEEYNEDPKWYRTLSKNTAFTKGEFIASMVDGVIKCEDEEIYQVFSNSSNYRIVDMAVCKCSCPNWKRVCSHLIAVALKYRQKNYVGRLAILSCVERFINYLFKTEADPKMIPQAITRITRQIKQTTFTEDYSISYHVVIEILSGILYRLYQQDRNTIPSIVPIDGGEKEPHTLQGEQDPIQYTLHDIDAPATINEEVDNGTKEKYINMDLAHVRPRIEGLIKSVKHALADVAETDELKRRTIYLSIEHMLQQVHSSCNLTNVEVEFLNSLIDSADKVDEQIDLYFSDCFALGVDSINCHSTQIVDDIGPTSNSSEIYNMAIEMISNAPELVNLFEYTMWDINFSSLGNMHEFILQQKLSFMQRFSFFYYSDRYIIKILSPYSFDGDLDIIQTMIDSVHTLESHKFVASTLALILKKQMSQIPDLSHVIASLDGMVNSDSNGKLAPFIIQSLELIPHPLVLLFAKVTLVGSKLLYKEHVDLIFSVKINPNPLVKLAMIGKAYNLPFILSKINALLLNQREGIDKPINEAAKIQQVIMVPIEQEQLEPSIHASLSFCDPTRGKELIDEIRKFEFGIGLFDCDAATPKEKSLNSQFQKIFAKNKQRIVRSIKRLSEDLYNTKIHLQLELIQNADDNDYDVVLPKIGFYLDKNAMVVVNNERGFQERDVRSICDIGASSKVGNVSSNKIGRFGIGFKSVFVLTNEPHVFSNGYNFKFSSDPAYENNIEYILPHWVDIQDYSGSLGFVQNQLPNDDYIHFAEFCELIVPNTILYLPLKQEYLINNAYKDYYREFQTLDASSLLFLRKICHISLLDAVEKVNTSFLKICTTKYKVDLESNKYLFAETVSELLLESRRHQLNESMMQVTKSNYIMIEYKFNLTSQQHQFLEEKHKSRNRHISIALTLENHPDQKFSVYNYLPICDYGLGFMVHADFVLSATRESILLNDTWNELLADKICDCFLLFLTIIQNSNMSNSNVYESFVRAIPNPGDGIKTFKYVCQRISSNLLNLNWILGYDGSFVKPHEALFIPLDVKDNTFDAERMDLFRKIVTPSILKELCGKYYTHERISTQYYRNKLVNLGVSEVGVDLLFNLVSNMLLHIDFNKSLHQQLEFIVILLENIGSILYLIGAMYEVEYFEKFLKCLVLYDASGKLFKMDKVYYTLCNLNIYDPNINIVSPRIFENSYGIAKYHLTVISFLNEMGCSEITNSNYLQMLKRARIKSLIQLFESGNNDLFEESKNVLKLYDNSGNGLDKEDEALFKMVPIKTTNGDFVALGDERLIFCPSNLDSCGDLDKETLEHFKAVDSLMQLPLEDIYKRLRVSDDYLCGSSEIVKTFQLLRKTAFIPFDCVNLTIVNYDEASMSHKRRGEIRALCEKMSLQLPITLMDVYSQFFDHVVELLNEIQDTHLTYELSRALCKTISLEITNDKLVSVLQDNTPFCHSGFYYQINELPWLPFGEFITRNNITDVMYVDDVDTEWRFTCLMSNCDRIESKLPLFKTIDSKINCLDFLDNEVSSRKIDHLDLLQIIANQVETMVKQKSTISVNDDKMKKCFAYKTFSEILNNPPRLFSILESIYSELNETIANEENEAMVTSIRESFKKMSLIIAMSSTGDVGVWESNSPNLCIHKSIVNHKQIACLEETFSCDSYELYSFWKFLGINDYIGHEYCLKLLDSMDTRNPHSVELVFQICIHLYNTMETEEFVKCAQCCPIMPLVCDIDACFKWPTQSLSTAPAKHVMLEQPSNGIVFVKTRESLELLERFHEGSIWLVMAPFENIMNPACRYYREFHSKGTICEIWFSILEALGASDFVTRCKPRIPLDFQYSHERAMEIKLYILVPLLPYIHHYIKVNNHELYTRQGWESFTKMLKRLKIFKIDKECLVAYEYANNDGTRVESRPISKSSQLYKFKDGIYWFINVSLEACFKVPLDPCDASFLKDLLSAPTASSLPSLTIDFFTDLSSLVLDPLDDESEQQIQVMGKFLYSLYEMIKTCPKTLVDSFARNFCCGNATLNCMCSMANGIDIGQNSYGTHFKSAQDCNGLILDMYVSCLLDTIRMSSMDSVMPGKEYKSAAKEFQWNTPNYSRTCDNMELQAPSALESLATFDKSSKNIAESCIQEIDTSAFTNHNSRLGTILQDACPKLQSSAKFNKSLGEYGEEFAYNVLLELYREDIKANSVAVIWHNEHRESGYPYDITIENCECLDDIIYIEVKSTNNRNKTYFEVSHREWLFAQTKASKYEILRVSGIGTSELAITRIVNPYLLWNQSKLGFCLSL
ncbi:bifunctional Histidine kinase-HSP90-like ATPase superfamily/Zinc finger [Babesia duncani]|uniref:Bifunctional Histidine kinase-HSP90-like ATPase superfamily/Zinc finger n=1 Tax=Babesia duncani TaxID=323732 RepID=A0AAD9UPM3_9APIC|nr:bifunctional Histidine kinase-HSP90-like ATPase superfamily/Zinc finger [Babesia duncani]